MAWFDTLRFRLFARKKEPDQLQAADRLRYPEDRELLRVILESKDTPLDVRVAAVRQLPFPEGREFFQFILESENIPTDVRVAAVRQLPFPEGRDLARSAALADSLGWVRAAVIEKCRYPEDLGLLYELAGTWGGRKAAEKLPYPEERERLVRLARDGSTYVIENILPYPEEKELLEAFALHSELPAVRDSAICRLSCPACRETLELCAVQDASSGNRERAAGKLSYPESRSVLCSLALHDPSASVRCAAVQKLPYPEEAEILTEIARRPGPEGGTRVRSREEAGELWTIHIAQFTIARSGVCPLCGAEIHLGGRTVYMNDDPNDVSRDIDVYRCYSCGLELENWD